MILLIILAVVLIIVLIAISIYNSLVKLRQKVKNAWSQIEVQLQRRFDLIPNIVETVKGYMQHEEGVLTKVTELRSSWMNSNSIGEKAELDNQLSSCLKTLFSISENYPDLKASTNFTGLQTTLEETENKISFSRQFYNDSVTIYNTKLEVFPSNLFASMFGFKPEVLFNVTSDEAKNNVKIDFNK